MNRKGVSNSSVGRRKKSVGRGRAGEAEVVQRTNSKKYIEKKVTPPTPKK